MDGDQKMSGFKRTTVRDQVYELIRSKILSQEFPFGSRINIDTLSAQLHVSNSPIREALIMLENNGLLTMHPNSGARVIEFTESSYLELNTAVCTLLFGAYEICVLKEETPRLADLLSHCVLSQKQAAKKNDPQQQVQSAMSFDRCFFTIADNHYLAELYEKMENVIYLQILGDYQRVGSNMDQNISEHEMILKNIEEKNTRNVKRWLQIHYDRHIEAEM